jgi:RES domain-containing protein
MLEKLVHSNFIMPANQHYIEITIPNGTSYEVFQTADHPGWDGKSEAICKAFAQAWYGSGRTAILFVPSIPARLERNFLINPAHPEAKKITHELPQPVWWDARLYGKLP